VASAAEALAASAAAAYIPQAAQPLMPGEEEDEYNFRAVATSVAPTEEEEEEEEAPVASAAANELAAFASSAYIPKAVDESSGGLLPPPPPPPSTPPAAAAASNQPPEFLRKKSATAAATAAATTAPAAATAVAAEAQLTDADRKVLTAVAGLGLASSGFVVIARLTPWFGPEALCAAAEASFACNDVLSSPWSMVPLGGGLSLPLLGFLSYNLVILLAIAPLAVAPLVELRESVALSGDEGVAQGAGRLLAILTEKLLLMVTTSQAVVSSYLLAVLVGLAAFSSADFDAGCAFCVLSALVSTSLAAFTWVRSDAANSEPLRNLAGKSASSSALASLLIFASSGLLGGGFKI
jgi:uncharacterized membrane protein